VALNTSFTDARYAQLTANNTFTGVQVINNSVGIDTSPSFPLHVNGRIRGEAGMALSSTGTFDVDAPFINGGRFRVQQNGNVGINNTNPVTTLDVVGNINASGALSAGNMVVAGGGVINGSITTSAGITTGAGVSVGGPLSAGALTIGNDAVMSATPHMNFGGKINGLVLFGEVAAAVIPDKDILITRMDLGVGLTTDCSFYGTISLARDSPLNEPFLYSLDIDVSSGDSGPISIPVTANTPLFLTVTTQPNCGTNGRVRDAVISVEYVMQ
jgi:hypothetical protein